MLASLPWYDLEEIRWATDRLWRELSSFLRDEGLRGVPRQLNRVVHYEQQWRSSRFVFGQACGYDLRIAHADRLKTIATPAMPRSVVGELNTAASSSCGMTRSWSSWRISRDRTA